MIHTRSIRASTRRLSILAMNAFCTSSHTRRISGLHRISLTPSEALTDPHLNPSASIG
jgi:hypothetical protein